MVKFISYDGKYPNLCDGALILEVDGKMLGLSHTFYSDGNLWFDENDKLVVETGPWSVDLPEDLEPYQKEIEQLVNDKVPHGCCGGCL